MERAQQQQQQRVQRVQQAHQVLQESIQVKESGRVELEWEAEDTEQVVWVVWLTRAGRLARGLVVSEVLVRLVEEKVAHQITTDNGVPVSQPEALNFLQQQETNQTQPSQQQQRRRRSPMLLKGGRCCQPSGRG